MTLKGLALTENTMRIGHAVGARLKGPVHSRDQGYLVLDPLERLQGGGQFERMFALGQVGLGFVGLEIVSIEKRGNPIFLAWKEGRLTTPMGT